MLYEENLHETIKIQGSPILVEGESRTSGTLGLAT